MKDIDVLIVGGGPAGLAAACELHKKGIDNILIVEREDRLGGILKQCIHDGFGLKRFGESLSGPEYAQRFIDEVIRLHIPYITDAVVTGITKEKEVTIVSPRGLMVYQAKAVILAMGCRERTRGALAIPGERPAGIYTAGMAQSYINIHNTMPGREIVILGSGDIGLIMARRLTLEKALVKAVFEILPYPSGLPRNIEQCLNDYNIPLYLSHTVTDIHGGTRLKSVTVSQVDEHLKPIPGTQKDYECDTLILSVGLIPENELSLEAGVKLDPRTKGAFVDEKFETNIEGIFAAGNVLHVHDLADFVSMEAEKAAGGVYSYIKNGSLPSNSIKVTSGDGVGHVLPQKISGTKDVTISLRPDRRFRDASLTVTQNGRIVALQKLRKAIPAEMTDIKIEADKLDKTGDLKVNIT